MATERFNRQFILLDFEDLDNPEFMGFVRAPEFSTYLVLRRYVWRSDIPHRLRLHEYYAQGLLASAISRDKIAECLGGVSPRQVTRDINALISRGIIKSVETGRGNVFILGKWGRDPEENIYYEYFYLDRLSVRMDKNVQAEWTSDIEEGQERPGCMDKSVQAAWTDLSTINRESNRETNRETSNLSKAPEGSSPSKEEGQIEELTSLELEQTIEACSREFGDLEHLESNLTRAFNLWAQTPLSEAEMLAKVREARTVTKQRVSSSAVRDRAKKMAYFFAVLTERLGLK